MAFRFLAEAWRSSRGFTGGSLGFLGGGSHPRNSPDGSGVGEEALLVFAGGFPDGVEGGALFLPFLGGVVDMKVSFEAVCDGVEVPS